MFKKERSAHVLFMLTFLLVTSSSVSLVLLNSPPNIASVVVHAGQCGFLCSQVFTSRMHRAAVRIYLTIRNRTSSLCLRFFSVACFHWVIVQILHYLCLTKTPAQWISTCLGASSSSSGLMMIWISRWWGKFGLEVAVTTWFWPKETVGPESSQKQRANMDLFTPSFCKNKKTNSFIYSLGKSSKTPQNLPNQFFTLAELWTKMTRLPIQAPIGKDTKKIGTVKVCWRSYPNFWLCHLEKLFKYFMFLSAFYPHKLFSASEQTQSEVY